MIIRSTMTHDKCQMSHQQNKKKSLSLPPSCQWMNRFHIKRPVKTGKTWQREERRMRTKVGWSVVRLQQFGRGQFGFCHARDLISFGLLKCQPCRKKKTQLFIFLYPRFWILHLMIWSTNNDMYKLSNVMQETSSPKTQMSAQLCQKKIQDDQTTEFTSFIVVSTLLNSTFNANTPL